jgi:hypothetical protein
MIPDMLHFPLQHTAIPARSSTAHDRGRQAPAPDRAWGRGGSARTWGVENEHGFTQIRFWVKDVFGRKKIPEGPAVFGRVARRLSLSTAKLLARGGTIR